MIHTRRVLCPKEMDGNFWTFNDGIECIRLGKANTVYDEHDGRLYDNLCYPDVNPAMLGRE